MKVTVVIPARNEAGNIGVVVRDVLACGDVAGVIVVDNGSIDGTASEAEAAGAQVVVEPKAGYGYACAAGTQAALADSAAIVVYMDGDQSSDAREIALLVEPLLDARADLVLGSRVLGRIEGGAMPSHQRFGNAVSARLMRVLYRLPVTDLGPFRAIRASTLQAIDMTEMTFGWPTEMTVKCARLGYRIVEVPVTWQARGEGASKVGGTLVGSVRAGVRIVAVTLRHAALRRPRSPAMPPGVS